MQADPTSPHPSAAAAAPASAWIRSAEVTLPSEREIRVTRDFAAPRTLVYDAFTRPDWVARWFGCHWQVLTLNEDDVRVGGKWRRILEGGHGTEGTPRGGTHAFSGEYVVLERPGKLVYTQRYENIPDTDHEVVITFEELAGDTPHTRMTMTFVHTSVTNRDGHLGSGMKLGLDESYGRVDALLRDAQLA